MAMLSSDDTEEALNTAPNGTGPFNFDSREAIAVDHARRATTRTGATHRTLGGVEFRVIPDETSIVSALAVGQRAVRRARRPARRPDRRGRQRHGRGDAAAQLPRAAAERPPRRRSPTSTCASPCSARSTASRCSTPPRSARARSPARSRRRPTGPTPTSRPCPERDLDKAAEYLDGRRQARRRDDPTIVSQGEYATSVNEAAEPPGPAGRRGHHARARECSSRRVRRPLDRRRLRGRGGAQRRPARPGRHVRPLLHEHRQPQRRSPATAPTRSTSCSPRARRPRDPDERAPPSTARSRTSSRTTPPGSGCSPATRTRPRRRRRRVRPDGQRLAAVPAGRHTRLTHSRAPAMIRTHPRAPVSGASVDAALTLLGVASHGVRRAPAIPGDQITAGLGTEAAALTPGQTEALVDYYGLDKPLVRSVLLVARQRAHRQPRLSSRSHARRASSTSRSTRCRSRSSWPCCRSCSRWSIGIPLGMLSASRPNSLRDAAGQVVGLAGLSIPAFLLARRCSSRCSPSRSSYNPNGKAFATLRRGPVAQPPAAAPARRGARLRHRRADHAHHAHRRCWRCGRPTSSGWSRAKGVPPAASRSATCCATRSCRSSR